MTNDTIAASDIVNGTVGIVAAYLGRNPMAHTEVPAFMRLIAAELATGVASAARGVPTLGNVPVAALASEASPLAIAAPVAITAPAEVAAAVEAPVAPVAAETPAEEAPAPVAAAPAEAPVAAEVEAPAEEEPYKFAHLSRVPTIDVGGSVTNELVYCLFDGVGKKMLKRHIRARYGMEEAEYREHFGLPKDYPLRAPGYAAEKSLVAKAQGLGTEKISKAPRAEREATVTPMSAAA